MSLDGLSDKELNAFITNYELRGKVEEGKFSLADLCLEKQRRVKSPFPPIDVAREIVRAAKQVDDGLVTYKEIWEVFRPGQVWAGNAPRAEMAKALAAVIACCVDRRLPILTTLVVRAESRAHSRDAIENIYNETKSLGIIVGSDPQAFVAREQDAARSLAIDVFAFAEVSGR